MLSIRKKLIIGLLVLTVGWALFANGRPQKCADDVCGAGRGAPPYGTAGTHAVGRRLLTMGDHDDLPLTLWYPAPSAAAANGAAIHATAIKLGAPLGTVTVASTPGGAVPEAAFSRAGAPWPLVVLSPGFGMSASSYGWLAEHLASHGFVVAAPEHAESLDPENQLWRSAVSRPDDIAAVYAFMDRAVQPGGALAGLIDPQLTAVVGHSYGGYTALVAAGARIDTASFTNHCTAAVQAAEPAAWLCDMLLPNLGDMAALAGLDEVPDGLWPARGLARVDGVVTMAGDAFFFGQPGMATSDVPLLAIGGTADADTPFTWGPQPTYDHTAGSPKALLALEGGEHMIFTNPCTRKRWYMRWMAGEFCADATWERSEAHGVIAYTTTAFLLATLTGDQAAADALAPGGIQHPNVTYEARGY